MNTLLLEAENLTIGYSTTRGQARVVAEELSLSLHAGELVCLIGPNGAGKSTLLRTLAGMQRPLKGKVLLHNLHDLHALPANELARHLAIVLTERVSISGLTGYALVALGRHPHTDWSGRLNDHDEKVIQRAVEAVGAAHLAERLIDELSDGERQRLMIARALAQQPDILILDEPTAFLDLPRRVETLRLLRDLARATGCAVLLSTHDLDLALRTADRLWLLSGGGAFDEGAPEDLVLNGALGKAFQSEGVQFDPLMGSFQMTTTSVRQVTLQSVLPKDHLRLIWTARALERAGFSITTDAPLHIVVKKDGWAINEHQFSTIGELMATLHQSEKVML